MGGYRDLLCLLLFGWILMCFPVVESARQQRCYNCRSRGPLGDCRDPFYTTANSTIPQGKQNSDVKIPPCASGWCKKFIGKLDLHSSKTDQGELVERGCLGGGPDDEKSRCFEVPNYKNGVSGTLCICKGDLCNSSPVITSGSSTLIGLCLLATMAWRS